jgi:hypothetical protein
MKAGAEARRFRAEAIVTPLREGVWGSSIVKIFDGATEIGQYERNYPSFAAQTFEPFELGGAWYALYSRDYTATRVMSLPECRDLGGEEPNSGGFCPVELYVPRYKLVTMTNRATGEESQHHYFESYAEGRSGHVVGNGPFDFNYGPWLSLDTGFVAGCVWGDDNSWKLQVIDLTRAAEGIIVRSERFGYLELVDGLKLADAVRLDSFLPHWQFRLTISRRERRDMATGAVIDPFDE